MLGAGDCELIRVDGLLAQPVNALSALAFVAVGVWLVVRRRSLLGVLTVAVGIGSFLFHGPQPAGAKWIHDVSILWLLAALIVPGGRNFISIAGAAAIVVLMAPGLATPLTAIAAIAAAIATVRASGGEARRVARGGMLAGIAGAVAWLGRTGGPACDPVGIVQFHALWHVVAAMTVAAWAITTSPKSLRDSY